MRIHSIISAGQILLFFALAGSSCKKYAAAPDIAGAAYLRVFNDIPFTLTLTNKAQVVPFFTMIVDPDLDKNGTATGGKVIGDYLGARQIFNSSTSSNEGNALGTSLDTTIKYNINYEYPGNAHVLAAPSINGFDLSAWAQVASGKHRILFIARPENYTDFAMLSDTIKRKIVIDTTIDLAPGEVYTLETVLQDVDASKYGIYLRKETFPHQTFDANKNYVAVYNLSGQKSSLAGVAISPSSAYFYDTMNVSYTLFQVQVSSSGNVNPVVSPNPSYNGISLGNLTKRMETAAPFYPLPLLPPSELYDPQGDLRTFEGDAGTGMGTLPYFLFAFLATGNNIVDGSGTTQQYSLICDYDPVTVDNLSSFYLSNHSASLNMLVRSNGQVTIYPAIYIMEMVFNKVYLMQVQQKL